MMGLQVALAEAGEVEGHWHGEGQAEVVFLCQQKMS